MTFDEALNIVVARTGHQRFRELCLDSYPDHVAWRSEVVRLAETTEGDPVSSDPWLPLIRACEDHNPGCCASPVPYCSRFTKHVTHDDCVACLEGQGIKPQ